MDKDDILVHNRQPFFENPKDLCRPFSTLVDRRALEGVVIRFDDLVGLDESICRAQDEPQVIMFLRIAARLNEQIRGVQVLCGSSCEAFA